MNIQTSMLANTEILSQLTELGVPQTDETFKRVLDTHAWLRRKRDAILSQMNSLDVLGYGRATE